MSASVNRAQFKFAPHRFAALKFAPVRSAPERSAPARFALCRSLNASLASISLAPERSALARLAPLKSAVLRLYLPRSAPLRSAPCRSGNVAGCDRLHVFQLSTPPCLNSSRCCWFAILFTAFLLQRAAVSYAATTLLQALSRVLYRNVS